MKTLDLITRLFIPDKQFKKTLITDLLLTQTVHNANNYNFRFETYSHYESKDVLNIKKSIKSNTEINADLGYYENTIIVIGHYKNGDYINMYNMNNSTFTDMVDYLNYLKKNGCINRVDVAPQQFKWYIEKSKC